jgi:hypothetical protein
MKKLRQTGKMRKDWTRERTVKQEGWKEDMK